MALSLKWHRADLSFSLKKNLPAAPGLCCITAARDFGPLEGMPEMSSALGKES